MLKGFKRLLYRVSKSVGLFAVARRVTAGQLRILCYHGLAIGDEHLYSPGLFMRPETVRSRFETLVRSGYPIIPLGEACEGLRAGTLPPCPVVITYDDGFYGNYVHGVPLHREFPLPATLYATTYYVVKGTPIFRHAVKYMFWKTGRDEMSLDGLPGVEGKTLRLAERERVEAVQWELIRYGETQLDEPGRVALARELGGRLGVDYDDLARSRRLSLMTPGELLALSESGIDIQLHTHRHQFPPVEEQARREIEDNRAVLESMLGRACNHLCYPSGVFTTEQWPWLEACGIASATTCEAGLNDSNTPHYGLRRFLDAETIAGIEFEAEISGFAELLRRARALFRREPSPSSASSSYAH